MSTNSQLADPYVPDNPIARVGAEGPARRLERRRGRRRLGHRRQAAAADAGGQAPTTGQNRIREALEKVAQLVATRRCGCGRRRSSAGDAEQPSSRRRRSLRAMCRSGGSTTRRRTRSTEARQAPRALATRSRCDDTDGSTYEIPPVSPEPCRDRGPPSRGSGCPAGPPRDAKRPAGIVHRAVRRARPAAGGRARHRLHPRRPSARTLDARVTWSRASGWTSSVDPPEWKPNPPDEITLDADGQPDRDRRSWHVHRRAGRARLPAGGDHGRRPPRQRGQGRRRRQPVPPVGLGARRSASRCSSTARPT